MAVSIIYEHKNSNDNTRQMRPAGVLRKDIYVSTFVRSKDERYLSQFPPSVRSQVPDYGWSVLNNYEEFIPAMMTESEMQYRWNLSKEELDALLETRHDYTNWEIAEVKRRQRSKKPEHKIRPTIVPIFNRADEPNFNLRTLIFAVSEARESMQSAISALVRYHFEVLNADVTKMIEAAMKTIIATIKWYAATIPHVRMSLQVEEDVFKDISDVDYDTVETARGPMVLIDYIDVVHILSYSTLIPPKTCDTMLKIICDAKKAPNAFMYARAVLFIKAGVPAPRSWVKQIAPGLYSPRSTLITEEFFRKAIVAMYPHHKMIDTAAWHPQRRILMHCKKHGEQLVTPREYISGKNCCRWDFAPL